ncbi:MAG TPA: J domain-containing protein [Terriglobia bacterium]|nr:J domain-containing protein [Terriglobia bacterium]
MDGRDDLYIILEVGRAATVSDIKKAFRKLARRFHPDVNPGDHHAEERFKRITEAYEVLSHPDKRHFYDENGFYTEGVAERVSGNTAWGFTFQGFNFTSSTQDPLSEVFGQYFTRPARPRSPERGADREYQISISFADAISGLKTRISVLRRRLCPSCAGESGTTASGDHGCASCGGTGKTVRMKGRIQFAATCPECGGAGRTQYRACFDCDGDGRISRTDTLEVQIPAGVGPASRVRIPGEGDAGRYGGPTGDLYVITNVAPHPFWSRVGEHIQCTLPISFSEAALGAKVDVPTVEGSSVVRIPPGTQNGQVFRMRGKGAPSLLRPGTRGDQLVEVRIVVPRVADERSKEILREFARLNSADLRKGIAKD